MTIVNLLLLSFFWTEIPRKNIPQNIWCIIPQHIWQYMVYIMWCNMKFFHVWRESLVSPQHHVFMNLTPRLAVNGKGNDQENPLFFFCLAYWNMMILSGILGFRWRWFCCWTYYGTSSSLFMYTLVLASYTITLGQTSIAMNIYPLTMYLLLINW